MSDRYLSNVDPVITAWAIYPDGGRGGTSPAGLSEVLHRLEDHGHVILTDSRYARPINHNLIGVGVGHNDAVFAETGESMAAYYEQHPHQRWWEDTGSAFSTGVKYYGCRPTHHDRIISKPTPEAQAIRRQAS